MSLMIPVRCLLQRRGGTWFLWLKRTSDSSYHASRSSLVRRSPRMLLNEGDAIRESYQVERFLGEGAFAEVYRVKHRVLGRLAMKVFKLLGTMEETQLALKEPIMLSEISHRNVIRVFDA